MSAGKVKNWYQYRQEADFDIYLVLESGDLESEYQFVIHELGFSLCEAPSAPKKSFFESAIESLTRGKKSEQASSQLGPGGSSGRSSGSSGGGKGSKGFSSKKRVLEVSEATPNVKAQISRYGKEHKFLGDEFVFKRQGYEVHIIADFSLMVYSPNAEFWQVGIARSGKDSVADFRSLLNTYLSYALVEKGLLGFWGQVMDGELCVMSREEAKGRAFFVDPKNFKVFTEVGEEEFGRKTKVLRLDPSLKDRERKLMSREEFYAFLVGRVIGTSYTAVSLTQQETIQYIVQRIPGLRVSEFGRAQELTPSEFMGQDGSKSSSDKAA